MYMYMYGFIMCVYIYIYNIIILCMGTSDALYVGVYAHVQRCRTYATSLRPAVLIIHDINGLTLW